MAAAVYIGNSIAHSMGCGSGRGSLSTAGYDQALQSLNLSTNKMPELLTEFCVLLQQVKCLYNLGA